MTELRKLGALIERNIKCYFKDKFLFFVSLITPMILLVLFITFLRSTYIKSFNDILTSFSVVPQKKTVEGLAGAWLLSSILAVCSVTVAICSNAIMVQDKAEGAYRDLMVSPVKEITIKISYFIADFVVTLMIMTVVLIIGFVYLACVGWCLSFGAVMTIIFDMICCVLFGSLLASVIESFLSSQGALSALSALVSAMYGFICGAYMPLSQFSSGVRNVLCVLPGTYGVGLIRKHLMTGYVDKLGQDGLIEAGQRALLDAFDGNLYVADMLIPSWAMYTILLGTCAVLLVAYVLIISIDVTKGRKHKTSV